MLFFKIKDKNDTVQIRHTYLIQASLHYSCVIGVVVVFMEVCEKLFIHKHYIREARGRGFYCENASRNPYIYIVAILIKVFTPGKSAASRPLAGECLRKAVWTQRRETYWADDMYSVRGIFLTLCLAPAVSVFTLTACFLFLKKSHDELFLLSNNELKSLSIAEFQEIILLLNKCVWSKAARKQCNYRAEAHQLQDCVDCMIWTALLKRKAHR